ncbi:hypothetical protein BZG36_03148 [Bifiguratus adelaidae]|uniref:FHA domain-containing protein n=1 Tax=Bifiguratus adelaidae TaxID=1938954 RepID=A0A261XXL1_9FUNG|nr:hypothetical protein BZG36_03148 [Bifiguratus adelaidae]
MSVPQIRLIPHIDWQSYQSFHFAVIRRSIPHGKVIKVGRYTERVNMENITFKSKVVSRSHAEIWTRDDKVFIKDTGSSSGTFLNHMRLSGPNQESTPFELHEGDILQLGCDFQGGCEDVFRCVKMRVELNHSETAISAGHGQCALDRLQSLADQKDQISKACRKVVEEVCSICLPFLMGGPYPGFQCPMCRTYSDLDASVAEEEEEGEEHDKVFSDYQSDSPEEALPQCLATDGTFGSDFRRGDNRRTLIAPLEPERDTSIQEVVDRHCLTTPSPQPSPHPSIEGSIFAYFGAPVIDTSLSPLPTRQPLSPRPRSDRFSCVVNRVRQLTDKRRRTSASLCNQL